MTSIEHSAPTPESLETPKNPVRLVAALAATALAAGLAIGAAEGYKTYQELQDPHYSVDLDTIVGGSEH